MIARAHNQEEIEVSSSSCDLCGLALRRKSFGSALAGEGFSFCCMGCKQVFTMLSEASGGADPNKFKETALFKKCQEMGIVPGSEADLEKRAQRERDQGFMESAVNGLSRGQDRVVSRDEAALSLNLRITHMWCPACAWVIEACLMRGRGILDATCNFSTDRVRCDYDPVLTSPSRIIQTLEGLGYKAFIPGEAAGSTERKKEFIRFAISAFLTINVMMLSFGLYSGFLNELSQGTIHRLSWPAFIMASIVLFYGGRRIYQRAWAGLTSAAFSMETLITIGAFSAYLYSTAGLISGSIHLYFDTACMLITLVLLGKTLESRAKGQVQEGLENFFSLRPTKVRICSDQFSEGRYVSAEQLRKGDSFRVEEGEVIAGDGLLLEGKGAVDESSLTGEARPVFKKAGHRVRGGTRVIQGILKIKAEAVGEASTLGQMIMIMERALGKRTPLEGKTDRALQWFVPLILSLAAGTALVCWLSGLTTEEAVIRAVTVMVIACPCTLGVAIPLARVAGISVAGRKGLLVRDFSSFERAGRVGAFVFDKTGTVTTGKWTLRKIVPFGSFTEKQVLGMAACLERNSDHYIGAEIKRRAREAGQKPVSIEGVEIFENGISGMFRNEEIKIGSREFLAQELKASQAIRYGSGAGDEAYSFVFMSLGGKPCALLVFGDKIRASAFRAMEQLQAQGHRVVLVSGDDDKTTKTIGEKMGLKEAYGGMLPQDKSSLIRDLQREGYIVAMVGDGINDAPALVHADLAIAVHSGSHLGKEVGDLTLMRGEPDQVVDFLRLAKKVNGKVIQNLTFSFLYNIISIPIAMSGLLNPLVAVCAMLMSSLSVIGNTLLLARKGS